MSARDDNKERFFTYSVFVKIQLEPYECKVFGERHQDSVGGRVYIRRGYVDTCPRAKHVPCAGSFLLKTNRLELGKQKNCTR